MERSGQTGPGPIAAEMDDAGATAGRTFPARWMTAQSKQYSAAAGAGGFDWAGASAEPCPTVPMAGWEAVQQAVCPQCTWLNKTINWTASANSAHHDPNLRFDRTQLI